MAVRKYAGRTLVNASPVTQRSPRDHARPGRMSKRSSYLVVVPAYNESETIAAVVEAVRERAPRFDTLVIDDGSTDNTNELAARAGARVVKLPFNLGIGGAVQTDSSMRGNTDMASSPRSTP